MRKIMIIGSDAATINAVAGEISRDYIVLQSSRGEKAVDLLPLFEPDAMVLLKTSGRPDLACLSRSIQSHPVGRHIPIVLMASKGSAFLNISGPNLHPIPTISIPILRAILKGVLHTTAAATAVG